MRPKIETNEASFKQGMRCYQEKDYATARDIFHRRIQELPNAENYYWYAFMQDMLENHHSAIYYYQLAIHKVDSKNNSATHIQQYSYKAEAYFKAAALYVKIKNHPAAIECLRQGIEYAPKSSHFHEALADLFSQREDKKDLEWAIEHYLRTMELKPNITSLFEKIAPLYAKTGKYSEAIACYEKAIQNTPKNPHFHFQCGLLYQRLFEINAEISDFHHRAQEYFHAAADLQFNQINSHNCTALHLFYSYHVHRKQKKTLKAFETLLRKSKNDSRDMVHYYYARIIALKNAASGLAILHYCRAIHLNPKFLEVYDVLYNYLINIKKNYDNDLEKYEYMSHLKSAIQCFSDQDKKINLLKILLDDTHGLGACFLSHASTDADVIYSIIKQIPLEKDRKTYLMQACRQMDSKLYEICHRYFLFSNSLKSMTEELQIYTKYDDFFALETAEQADKPLVLVQMIKLVPKGFLSHYHVFEPVIMGHIIGNYNQFANQSDPGSIAYMAYGTFISHCKVADLSKIIFTDNKIDKDAILLDCLNEKTILGKKFLIQEPDRDLVRDCILALPENTPEALQRKHSILKKVLQKEAANDISPLHALFWTPRYLGATVSTKKGILLKFRQEWERIEAILFPLIIDEFELLDMEGDEEGNKLNS